MPVSEATVQSALRLLLLGGVLDDNASQMDHRLKAACRAANVKRYTAHHLRHTFGTVCLRNRADLRTLQDWMGHRNPDDALDELNARFMQASVGYQFSKEQGRLVRVDSEFSTRRSPSRP